MAEFNTIIMAPLNLAKNPPPLLLSSLSSLNAPPAKRPATANSTPVQHNSDAVYTWASPFYLAKIGKNMITVKYTQLSPFRNGTLAGPRNARFQQHISLALGLLDMRHKVHIVSPLPLSLCHNKFCHRFWLGLKPSGFVLSPEGCNSNLPSIPRRFARPLAMPTI
mgnify:CR=1 FL=1